MAKKNALKPSTKLPPAWSIFKQSLHILWRHRWLFAGIIAIYAGLTIFLVQGLNSGVNVTSLKQTLTSLQGGSSPVADSITLFGAMLSSVASTNSAVGATYQSILLLLISLVLIWALRQAYNMDPKTKITKKNRIKIKQSFYQGTYPLVPFTLVLLLAAVQLLPLLIGGGIYSTVTSANYAITPIQQAMWGVVFVALAVWSLYMITATLFGLYIVTLPNMEPVKAVKAARTLVKNRRWTVMRKVLFLPLALLLLVAAIMLPLLMFATIIAQWVFFVLSLFSIAIIHSYMYTLYKELL